MFKYVKYTIEYKVDWVSVYQEPDDPKQKVRCSTLERPTKICIETHEEIYKNDQDMSSRLSESLMENMMHVVGQ